VYRWAGLPAASSGPLPDALDPGFDVVPAGPAPHPSPEAVRKVVTTVIVGVIRDDIPGPVTGS
jgi:hypothetical protein